MSEKLRCAVIGVGYLGQYHAQKYACLDECELVAVVDTLPQRAQEVAARFDCLGLSDIVDLPDVDAVSVVVPTSGHHQVASYCLARGFHVLVEKPIASNLAQADDLIEAARGSDRVLMVGHLERFNSVLLAMDWRQERPRFIESHRLTPFKSRATDVDVVLDLMIHDIDIILELVDSEVVQLAACGSPVLTDEVDIANARLQFANGSVANVTASRVSLKDERKMRLFLPQRYVSLDFQAQSLSVCWNSGGEIQQNRIQYQESDALLAEIRHFIDCILHKSRPLVAGEAGRRALATAIEITNALSRR